MPAPAQPRRQHRWARHAFTLVIFLLACAVGGLWWRSLTDADTAAIFIGSDGKIEAVGSSHGVLGLVLTNVGFGAERAWTVDRTRVSEFPAIGEMLDANLVNVHPRAAFEGAGLGFGVVTSQPGVVTSVPGSEVFIITAPHWAVMTLLTTWAFWRIVSPAARRKQRLAKGLCPQCGYDLRASPERCPECGAVTPRTPAQQHEPVPN